MLDIQITLRCCLSSIHCLFVFQVIILGLTQFILQKHQNFNGAGMLG